MRFEWDESKREINIAKHGIDLDQIEQVFRQFVYTIEDERFDYGEVRYFTWDFWTVE
jgi:hypothetical protein